MLKYEWEKEIIVFQYSPELKLYLRYRDGMEIGNSTYWLQTNLC